MMARDPICSPGQLRNSARLYHDTATSRECGRDSGSLLWDNGGPECLLMGVAMVPLRVLTLVVPGQNQPSILVLEPSEEKGLSQARIVPIWIGTHEAAALGIALEQVKLPRPATHDLLIDALTNLDATIDHAVITDMRGQTFFANLVLKQGDRTIVLDARPTDALSLAIRQGAPFYIVDDLLERASYPYVFKEARDEEAEFEEFRHFLDDIAPDDFA